MTWHFRPRMCLIAAGFAAGGCGSILDIKVYDQDAESGASDSSVSDQANESSAIADAAPDVTSDADASVDHQADAGSNDDQSNAADADAETEAGCLAGLTTCGDAGVCALLATDVRNCGGCGNDCTRLPGIGSGAAVGCSGGHCTYQCLSGYADCADAGSGCVWLGSNPNCGACRMDCSDSGELCSPGAGAGTYACTLNCTGGTTLCGSTCVNETTNTQPNAPNCGGCGTQFNCSGGKTCQSAACTCPLNETDCGGTCTNTNTDSNNCGGCGSSHVCPAGTQCSGGQCACTTAGLSLCNGVCINETTNTQPNATNCGGCGSQFTCSGGETCRSGACACPAGQTNCGGTCTNTQTDNNNCGGCGASDISHICPSGTQCTSGQCESTTYCCTVSSNSTTGTCTSTVSSCTDTVFGGLGTSGDLVQLQVQAKSSALSYSIQATDGRFGGLPPGFCVGVGGSNSLTACFAVSWSATPPSEGEIATMRWTFGTALVGATAEWHWCYGEPRADGSCQLGTVFAGSFCCDAIAQSIQPNTQGTYEVQLAPTVSCTLASGGDMCAMSTGGTCGASVPTTDRCGLGIVGPCSCTTGQCTAGGTCP